MIPVPIINKILSYRGLHPTASYIIQYEIMKEFCSMVDLDLKFINYITLSDFRQIFFDKNRKVINEKNWRICRENIFYLIHFWDTGYGVNSDILLDNFISECLGNDELFYFGDDEESKYNKENENYRKEEIEKWIRMFRKSISV